MSAVRYELCSYIAKDANLHSKHRENLKSYQRVLVPHSSGRNIQKIAWPKHGKFTVSVHKSMSNIIGMIK
jgi:hypothetical protein